MASIRKNGGKWISQYKRLAIYARDNMTCVYCNASHDDLTLDHVICHSHNGSDSHNNLVTACRSCNSQRCDTLIKDYATSEQMKKVIYAIAQDITLFESLTKQLIKENKYTPSKQILLDSVKG